MEEEWLHPVGRATSAGVVPAEKEEVAPPSVTEEFASIVSRKDTHALWTGDEDVSFSCASPPGGSSSVAELFQG